MACQSEYLAFWAICGCLQSVQCRIRPGELVAASFPFQSLFLRRLFQTVNVYALQVTSMVRRIGRGVSLQLQCKVRSRAAEPQALINPELLNPTPQTLHPAP